MSNIGVHTAVPTGGASGSRTSGNLTTTNGSTVFLIGCGTTWGATPVNDSKTNTWVAENSPLTYSTGPNDSRIYKCVGITGGSGHNFTFNPASGGFIAGFVLEVVGAVATPTIISARQVGTHNTSTPYVSPSINPLTNVVLFGAFWSDAPDGTESTVWGGSFASGNKIEENTDANTGITGSLAAVDIGTGTYNGSVTASLSGNTGPITDTANWIVSIEVTVAGGGAQVPYQPNYARAPTLAQVSNEEMMRWHRRRMRIDR